MDPNTPPTHTYAPLFLWRVYVGFEWRFRLPCDLIWRVNYGRRFAPSLGPGPSGNDDRRPFSTNDSTPPPSPPAFIEHYDLLFTYCHYSSTFFPPACLRQRSSSIRAGKGWETVYRVPDETEQTFVVRANILIIMGHIFLQGVQTSVFYWGSPRRTYAKNSDNFPDNMHDFGTSKWAISMHTAMGWEHVDAPMQHKVLIQLMNWSVWATIYSASLPLFWAFYSPRQIR